MAQRGVKKYSIPNLNSLRNLPQNRDKTDEELRQMIEDFELKVNPRNNLERRIEKKLSEFGEDYDLSDLKINDKLQLRSLIQAMLQLEDIEQEIYTLREAGISSAEIALIQSLNNVAASLRKDISSIQNDLDITRKARKGDKEQSVLTFIDDLNKKAKQFYESRMAYIFCPKCKMLLGSVWLKPSLIHDRDSKIQLICDRKLPDGSKCGEKVKVVVEDLYEKRGFNTPEVVPESLR